MILPEDFVLSLRICADEHWHIPTLGSSPSLKKILLLKEDRNCNSSKKEGGLASFTSNFRYKHCVKSDQKREGVNRLLTVAQFLAFPTRRVGRQLHMRFQASSRPSSVILGRLSPLVTKTTTAKADPRSRRNRRLTAAKELVPNVGLAFNHSTLAWRTKEISFNVAFPDVGQNGIVLAKRHQERDVGPEPKCKNENKRLR